MNKEAQNIINHNIIFVIDCPLSNISEFTAFHPSFVPYSQKKKSFINKKRKVSKNQILINDDDISPLDTKIDKEFECDEENDVMSSQHTQNQSIIIPLDNSEKSHNTLDSNKINDSLFKIVKKSKIGRKPKTSLAKSKHTKYSEDNILRKIKVNFNHKIINYINSIIISKYRNKIKKLMPLNGSIAKNNNIKYNRDLLNTKLKDILITTKINAKFRLLDEYYNKEIIYSIYKEDIKELIDILEMTYLEIFKIFRDKIEKEQLKNFEKYDSVIRELKDEEENYINLFEKTVMNFENYYFNKSPRTRNKSEL